MKKYIALFLSFLMALSMTACTVSSEDVASIVNDLASEAEYMYSEEEAYAEESQEEPAETPGETEEPAEAGSAEEATEPAEAAPAEETEEPAEAQETLLDEHGSYDSKEDVALFIEQYGHLPDNYITKKEAQALGWSGGSLEPYAPGKCIGGSYFGNYEGILPAKDGRSYTECDIDTLGASSRGAKRIVFSNDGLIYYTEDHYETFELLYGDDSQ